MSMSEFIGQTLGQYRIETPIDAGGMGQVYRGVHIYLNRPAAIKVMRAHLASNPRFRDRFLQEARSAASLKHPNIVDIYEFGEQDGQLYLVMELVPDGSLRSLLHKRAKLQWPLSLGVDLMRQAAEGLAAAHALNVIHRDIKPDNMLLQKTSAQSSGYQLKISDFGLARLAEGSGLTATGAPLGTLAYMSPEQCLGQKVDGRTDLYSLGVVIYEVATGYLPFQIDSFDDALRKHTQAQPPSPRQVRPDVPQALENIILRCLAKRPEDRYQTGGELARDLRKVLDNAALATVGGALTPTQEARPYEVGTNVRSVGGDIPAPNVATLQGYSSTPRVRVLDQGGETLQVVELTRQPIIVGRQAGNAVVLNSTDISRQHAQVQWDGSQVTVKDLGSSNGTLRDNVRLQPNVNHRWQDREMLRVGPYFLRLEGAAADATMMQPSVGGVLPSVAQLGATYEQPRSGSNTYAVAGNGPRIGVRAEPQNLTITPGQPANVRVSLTNLGVLVDWLTVTAEGVPQEWVRGPGHEVQLNPGMQETVDLAINVARSPENRAQDYPVVIRARSREKPSESGTAPARWTVLPFKEDAQRIEPRKVTGRGRGNYTVTITNNGNVPANYALNGEDDEQKLTYQFRQENLSLEPGQETRVPLTLVSKRRFFGRDQSQRFQVQAKVKGNNNSTVGGSLGSVGSGVGGNTLNSNAEFVNRALIPPWVLTALSVLLALAIILGSTFALLNHKNAPTIITTGGNQTTTLPKAPVVQTTPPPNSVAPMALSPTPAPTQTLPPMQPATAPTTTASTAQTTNVFTIQATTANTSNNFTAINATLTNKNPNAGVFITQNVTPGGNGSVNNPHPAGVWFDNSNWAAFNEDDQAMTQQAAFNVWIPNNTNATFIQQATTGNISGSGTQINNPMVNGNPNLILLVTQNWNPGGTGGVFNPHPIGVTFSNGSWVVFNEDGAAMTPQSSYNVHVLNASNQFFVQTASSQNMTNGATVINNQLINNDPNAILFVTQLWNPGGSTNGVYNNHEVGVSFNGTNWQIVNEDQTPIPQGVSFNVVIVKQ